MVGGSLGLWGERMQFWAGGEFGVVGGADAVLGRGLPLQTGQHSGELTANYN